VALSAWDAIVQAHHLDGASRFFRAEAAGFVVRGSSSSLQWLGLN